MKSILVVDDDRIVRQSIMEMLRLGGNYKVKAAKDGFEGLEMARANPPDLIICDVEMPGLNGYGVVEALQQDTAMARIPFIFLTGRSDRGSMRQGMTLGADDYISKPFGLDELLEAVSARLAKRELIEEHYEQKLGALRDNILLAVPHELRTPLALIIGYGEVLAQKADVFPPEHIQALANTITNAGRRLHRLVENYIVYAQIELLMAEPGRVAWMRQIREARSDEIAQSVVRMHMEEYGRSAQLDLRAPDATLPISKEYLEKIMGELVDNAFKFSPVQTAVTLSTNIGDGRFTAVVSNKGRGMTLEQIRNIGVYMQFERKIHEQQGSGMGLAIAQKLTELHGGHLSIQSEPNVITQVTVSLPV
ncbi:MAG: hybrid sensor histidine kinase/response regulator [Chloroflexi bacterium]|nr:hybrid sensor histidine kinase/response regulator [Chloroflexota bacterium]